MTDIPREPKPEDRSSRAATELETVPQAPDASEAVEKREHRRAERERKAYDSHYRGTPQSPH